MAEFKTENLLVKEKKVTAYLLNPDHPDARGKAKLFIGHGFTSNKWNVFAEAVRRHAKKYPVKIEERTSFGTKFVIEGLLDTPTSEKILIRSVWMIKIDNEQPELVTVYPIS